jgi:hypothetical protein
MLMQCIDSLVQKVQSGVVINFEKIGPDPLPVTSEGNYMLVLSFMCFIYIFIIVHTHMVVQMSLNTLKLCNLIILLFHPKLSEIYFIPECFNPLTAKPCHRTTR